MQVGTGFDDTSRRWNPIYDTRNYDLAPDTTNNWFAFTPYWETASFSDSGNDQATLMLTPSGKAVPGVTDLAMVEAQVTNEITGLQEPASEVQFASQMPETASVDVTNADNSVWTAALVSYPAGTMPTVTPKGGNISYNGMRATNASLEIIDNDTGNILSTQTNTVIVGQQMNLSCQLSVTNAPSWNSMLTNFQWTVPGDAISNYVVAPDTSSAYVATNFPTTNSTAVFYWVDGATNRVLQCLAMIDGVTISNRAVFNVLRPTAQIITKTSSIAIGDAVTVTNFSVCFGTNGGPYGIVFSNTVTIPDETNYNEGNTNYSTEWVQVVEPGSTKTLNFLRNGVYGNFMKQATNVMLDTVYPYGFDPTLPYPDTSDSPFERLDLSTNEIGGSMSLNFEMWLMYQPTNGQWVPLREVSWNCAGAATNTGSGWGWVPLTSPSWSTNPPDTDAGVNYPTWTNNFYKLGFQKQL